MKQPNDLNRDWTSQDLQVVQVANLHRVGGIISHLGGKD